MPLFFGFDSNTVIFFSCTNNCNRFLSHRLSITNRSKQIQKDILNLTRSDKTLISIFGRLFDGFVVIRPGESNNKATAPKRGNRKRSRSSASEDMSSTDSRNASDDTVPFPVEEIVQHPLPGYIAPTSISLSPDDKLVAYLFSPDHSLSRRVFAFDLETGKHQMVFSPAGGGLDESNISEAEKLRRERARERGLGVTHGMYN